MPGHIPKGEMPRNWAVGLVLGAGMRFTKLPRKRAGKSPQHSDAPCQKMPPRRKGARQKAYLGIIWVGLPLGFARAGQWKLKETGSFFLKGHIALAC